MSSPHLCSRCRTLVRGKCLTCEQKRKAHVDANRLSPAARGYDLPWIKLRSKHLKANPTCVKCGNKGSHVDHVVAHRGNDALRLDPSNLQTLCASCHSKKTASSDGGFGNPKK
jgi:5-methylcytosine-specific restriction enzyme A